SALTADAETYTAGSGYTIGQAVPAAPNTKLITEGQVQTTAGTASASASIAASDYWTVDLAAFKASTGGGGTTPSITSLSPTSGVIGTSVTITGTNFGSIQGSSTATFNGTTASPTSWSATSIVAPVPSGATTGNVIVTVSGVASNGQTFTVGTSGPTVYYYLSDSLGTSRVITTSSATLCYDADFYPFGGERAYTTTCLQNYKFTGKERDSESNLDNFEARYDSSSMGRFMSPDPSGLVLADPNNPQQLNLYSYVRNNPLSLSDPSGLDSCTLDDASVDCGEVGELLSIGGYRSEEAAVQCPGPCQGTGTNSAGQTTFVQFKAFAGGVSGYFNPADLTNGINQVNGQIMDDANYQLHLQQTYASQIQNQLNNVKAGLAADFPGQGISANPNNPQIQGGHANFSLACTDGSSNCTLPPSGRYPNGIHIPKSGIVHDDAVSPWVSPFSFYAVFTTNFWEHGFVDLIGGQFVPVFSH
ncbi:MAG TPA: RHS repeat-associated core domain-containing protein, partial [Candidatus Acidoferrales bacterium]|nr:RHS repeat-associated core domain-containing protein [Candidatus Acidoferrales bacterium]